MKKILAILLTMLILVGCGSSNSDDLSNSSGSSGAIDTPDNTATESGTVDKSVFAGTYIGLHGSGITLFSTGGAEYFWKEWPEVETGDTWEYGDNKLTFHSRSLGYDIYADIEDGNLTSLNFKGVGDTSWDEEIFVKISNDTNSKDVDGYIALIEKQLNVTLDRVDEFVTDQFNGFELKIPKLYMDNKEINGDYSVTYQNKSGGGLILYGVKSTEETEEKRQYIRDTIDKYMVWILNEFLEGTKDGITAESEGVSEIEGVSNPELKTKSIKYLDSDGIPVYVTAYVDEESTSAFATIFISTDLASYDEIYPTIVESVTYVGNDELRNVANNINSEQLINGETENRGITPELKEFMDSYEAYIDEYVDFMKKYYENPTDLKMLADYAEMMQKYSDLTASAEKYKTDDMSNEDLKYYMDVMNRCNKKILDITN